MDWTRRRVLVTGGLGFIGSHLVDKLLSLDADVDIVDHNATCHPNIFALRLDHIREIYKAYGINRPVMYYDINLEHDYDKIYWLMRAKQYDMVFHLAAIFGGRAYVDQKQADCCAGFGINHNVIMASYETGVDRLNFASSACVYPPSLQNDPAYLLKEEDIISTGEGFKSSDNSYGWTKLCAELELKSYYEQYGFKSSSCRYLTVYGPWELDTSHAIAMLFKKAVDRQDPYEIWGTGEQERGFTYVSDIVDGSILACEKITNAEAVNLGMDKRYRIKDAAQMILDIVGFKPKTIKYLHDEPTGPLSRALDYTKAKTLLGWEPKVNLPEGLQKTYEWLREYRKAI